MKRHELEVGNYTKAQGRIVLRTEDGITDVPMDGLFVQEDLPALTVSEVNTVANTDEGRIIYDSMVNVKRMSSLNNTTKAQIISGIHLPEEVEFKEGMKGVPLERLMPLIKAEFYDYLNVPYLEEIYADYNRNNAFPISREVFDQVVDEAGLLNMKGYWRIIRNMPEEIRKVHPDACCRFPSPENNTYYSLVQITGKFLVELPNGDINTYKSSLEVFNEVGYLPGPRFFYSRGCSYCETHRGTTITFIPDPLFMDDEIDESTISKLEEKASAGSMVMIEDILTDVLCNQVHEKDSVTEKLAIILIFKYLLTEHTRVGLQKQNDAMVIKFLEGTLAGGQEVNVGKEEYYVVLVASVRHALAYLLADDYMVSRFTSAFDIYRYLVPYKESKYDLIRSNALKDFNTILNFMFANLYLDAAHTEGPESPVTWSDIYDDAIACGIDKSEISRYRGTDDYFPVDRDTFLNLVLKYQVSMAEPAFEMIA